MAATQMPIMPTQAPIVMPLAAPAPTSASPELEALRAMWPDLGLDVLAELLSYHKDVDKVLDMLLDVDTSGDADFARTFQAEQDAAVAKSVHDSLQAELAAEAEAKRQQEMPQVAARAVSNASLRAKAFFMQRRRAGSSGSSTHEARLLDAPIEIGDSSAAAYDMAPLQVPTYVPPPVASEAPRPPPAADAAAVAPAGAPPPALYNSRLDRARNANANRVRQQSRLSLGQEEASVGASINPLAPVAVPEGQLI